MPLFKKFKGLRGRLTSKGRAQARATQERELKARFKRQQQEAKKKAKAEQKSKQFKELKRKTFAGSKTGKFLAAGSRVSRAATSGLSKASSEVSSELKRSGKIVSNIGRKARAGQARARRARLEAQRPGTNIFIQQQGRPPSRPQSSGISRVEIDEEDISAEEISAPTSRAAVQLERPIINPFQDPAPRFEEPKSSSPGTEFVFGPSTSFSLPKGSNMTKGKPVGMDFVHGGADRRGRPRKASGGKEYLKVEMFGQKKGRGRPSKKSKGFGGSVFKL